MSVIDSILMVLRDGNWHSIIEVSKSVGYSEAKTVMIMKFLRKFGFVDLSKYENQLKLSSPMFKLMCDTKKTWT